MKIGVLVFERAKEIMLLMMLILTGLTAMGQSLGYEDLINLQRSDLQKAKGYFNYKGWKWTGTVKDCPDCLKQGGYDLVFDKTTWTNNTESIQLLQYSGHPNSVVYYTTQNGFNALESEAKNLLTAGKSGTEDNRIWSVYKSNGQQFTFNIKKNTSGYSNSTNYSVVISDDRDMDARVAALCSNCKGKGQITEHDKCSSCSGDGRQNCRGCSGKSKLYCQSCQEGKVQCNKCWGKGQLQCNKCWGKGNIQCTKCYSKGELQCSKCYGKGTVTQNVPGYSFERGCTNCDGKGKLRCLACDMKGSFRCENCFGTGNVGCPNSCVGGKTTCTRCSGNYSTNCTQCSGTGNTDLVCGSCSGTGQSSREIKKVCSVCNGSKKRTPVQRTEPKQEPAPDEEEELAEFFTVVEQMPEYPGGDAALLKYISQNVVYPATAKQKGITGVVYVSYVVDKNGSIRNAKLVRGADPLLDAEAIRVVKTISGYAPGKQRGQPVAVQFTMPIRFTL